MTLSWQCLLWHMWKGIRFVLIWARCCSYYLEFIFSVALFILVFLLNHFEILPHEGMNQFSHEAYSIMSNASQPITYSPPGTSVHRIFPARILEQVAICFSRGSSQPRDWTCVSWFSCIGRQILYHWATWEALSHGMKCESFSVVSDSLRPHGLYSPWNSLGQNTGVGSLCFLQGIFPTQGSNPGLLHCKWILYQLSHK